MGIPLLSGRNPVTSPLTTGANLPTPDHTPVHTPSKAFPTPLADSCRNIFKLDTPQPYHVPPAYTDAELTLALEHPPVEATLCYGEQILHGNLYYIPSAFYTLYERFLDISPSDSPTLDDPACKPWTLVNHIHGYTWVDESLLLRLGVNTTQRPNQNPRFIAVTDQYEFLLRSERIEECRLGGINSQHKLEVNTRAGAANDIIVGLPSTHHLLRLRRLTVHAATTSMTRSLAINKSITQVTQLKELTPTPVSPIVTDTVAKVLSAADDPSNITMIGVPKRVWVNTQLWEHVGEAPYVLKPTPNSSPSTTAAAIPVAPSTTSPRTPEQRNKPKLTRTQVLQTTSPLWPHRGNEAVFERSVWQQLCYSNDQKDYNIEHYEGGVRIPEPYVQVLFEDLQARARMPGTEELGKVDRKWYDAPAEDVVYKNGGLFLASPANTTVEVKMEKAGSPVGGMGCATDVVRSVEGRGGVVGKTVRGAETWDKLEYEGTTTPNANGVGGGDDGERMDLD